MAAFNLALVEDQYARYSLLDRKEVLKLLEWTEQQPHLPNISELEAIVFLHACWNTLNAAKLNVDRYFTMRTHVKDFFAMRSLDLESVQTAMETMVFIPLPGVTPDHSKVIYVKVNHPDVSKFIYADAIKVFTMVVDLWIMQQGIADGHIIAMDMNGMMFGHLARLNIMAMQHFINYIQDTMPVRLKGLHYFNIPTFMDQFVSIMKPFMKKDLNDALHLHESVDGLSKFVPLNMLPNECGGSAGPMKDLTAQQYQIVRDNAGYFESEAKRLVNEELRCGESRLHSSILDGNLRKLNID